MFVLIFFCQMDKTILFVKWHRRKIGVDGDVTKSGTAPLISKKRF